MIHGQSRPWAVRRTSDHARFLVESRKGQANVSQMYGARQAVTEEMAHVAKRENLLESLVMEEGPGRMIILANINHTNLSRWQWHRQQVQGGANIGASPNASDAAEEVKSLAVAHGADTVMDLSTGGVNLDEVRTAIIGASPVPIGTACLSGA